MGQENGDDDGLGQEITLQSNWIYKSQPWQVRRDTFRYQGKPKQPPAKLLGR